MRIVDPQVAIAMLHRETPAVSQPFHQQQQQQQTYPGQSCSLFVFLLRVLEFYDY